MKRNPHLSDSARQMGDFCVILLGTPFRREAPSAPPLGELLSECEAEGVCYEI